MKKLTLVAIVIAAIFSLMYLPNTSFAGKASVSLGTPLNNATNVAIVPTFTFSVSGETSCELRVATSSDLETGILAQMDVSGLSSKQYVGSSLSYEGVYFWGIATKDNPSFSTNGIRQFTVESAP